MTTNLCEKLENTSYDTNKLTREQAIELTSLATVEAVERENCEFVNEDEFGWQRWTAYVYLDSDGRPVPAHRGTTNVMLRAVYVVHKDEWVHEDGSPVEDGSEIDWEIDCYEIV